MTGSLSILCLFGVAAALEQQCLQGDVCSEAKPSALSSVLLQKKQVMQPQNLADANKRCASDREQEMSECKTDQCTDSVLQQITLCLESSLLHMEIKDPCFEAEHTSEMKKCKNNMHCIQAVISKIGACQTKKVEPCLTVFGPQFSTCRGKSDRPCMQKVKVEMRACLHKGDGTPAFSEKASKLREKVAIKKNAKKGASFGRKWAQAATKKAEKGPFKKGDRVMVADGMGVSGVAGSIIYGEMHPELGYFVNLDGHGASWVKPERLIPEAAGASIRAALASRKAVAEKESAKAKEMEKSLAQIEAEDAKKIAQLDAALLKGEKLNAMLKKSEDAGEVQVPAAGMSVASASAKVLEQAPAAVSAAEPIMATLLEGMGLEG